MTKPSLAARRQELIERCAEQRTGLAHELKALRPAAVLADHPVAGYVAAHRKLALALLGAGLGFALFGRKRLAGIGGKAGALLRTWTTIQGLLASFTRIAR